LANPLHCEVIAAGLVIDNAEEVERVGVVRLHRKNLAVERLRFRQTPSLMMVDRDLKRLRNRHIIRG
jgi:hypothetical protein